MLEGVLSLISSARVGFIGLYRDEETLPPVEYYASSCPTISEERDAIVRSTRCSRPETRASRPSPR